MKPFDLEAAKRGEPICIESFVNPCKFIGVDSKGWIVVELSDGSLDSYTPYEIFMVSKKQVEWVGLTDEQITKLLKRVTIEATLDMLYVTESGMNVFAKQLEQQLKDANT